MPSSWADFEVRVRALAHHIWGVPCEPGRLGGVNIDGVAHIDPEIVHLVEITEDARLGKVREDIVKLQTAKAAVHVQGVLARCFCVVNGNVTQAMRDAGEPHKIKVLTGDEFGRIFFDFSAYYATRSLHPFGSAVDPITGKSDTTKYIPVEYLNDATKKEFSTKEICRLLREKRTIVLLGEYGAGKSRAVREIFEELAQSAHREFTYPIAIDLRRSWGLESGEELIRRHFKSFGLDALGANAVRAVPSGSVAVLLDGFDEIGAQAWSSDSQKLRVIRAAALEGVKDLVKNSPGGKLITGRVHYFTSTNEMQSALGLSSSDAIVLRVKNEFNDTELLEYFDARNLDVELPEWLPRRPLICQTIATLPQDDFERMFGTTGNEVAFWGHFIQVLCERDAKIHVSFDANAIYRLFLRLSRLTRDKSANVGPISLTEMQESFEEAVGKPPDENASVMLQRLPSLGRIGAESNDLQFVDSYILGGLRARDVIEIAVSTADAIRELAAETWINPLDDLGQRIAATDANSSQGALLRLAKDCEGKNNRVLASDAIGALMRSKMPVDFGGLRVEQGSFLVLDFTATLLSNLSISESYAAEIHLPEKGVANVSVRSCLTPRVYGVSSPQGLPKWMPRLDAEAFDSVASQSRIRRIGLGPGHEMLVTIIRKTFFQRGSGRKEEALTRGFGQVASRTLASRILNLLVREGLLTVFKGDEGNVYVPNRSERPRMQALLDELSSSNDLVWIAVGQL